MLYFEDIPHTYILSQSYWSAIDTCMQVLHVHGFSGVGLHCAYLIVACYLLYSCAFDTFTKAWEGPPTL